MTSSAFKIKMSPTEINHIEPQFDADKLIESTLSTYSVDIRSKNFTKEEDKKDIYEMGYLAQEFLTSQEKDSTENLEQLLFDALEPKEEQGQQEERPSPKLFDKIFGYDPNRSEQDIRDLSKSIALIVKLSEKGPDGLFDKIFGSDFDQEQKQDIANATDAFSKFYKQTLNNLKDREEAENKALHAFVADWLDSIEINKSSQSTDENNEGQPTSPPKKQLTIQEKMDPNGDYFKNLMAKVRNRPAPPTYPAFVSESEKIYSWLHSSDDVGTVATHFVTSNHSYLNNIKQDASYVFVASGKFDGLGGQFFLRKTSETAGKAPYEN